MARDPYSVLGVTRQSSADEIRKAYRKLAKKYHPDHNPNDKEAEEEFKAISAAFDILGDTEKKGQFDRGEIDADGNDRPTMRRGAYSGAQSRSWASHGAGGAGGFSGGTGYEDIGDIFSEFFGHRAGRQQPRPQRGQDVRYRLSVDFLEAARGKVKRVTLADGRHVDVTIPEGLRDGQTLRLKGKGQPGVAGGPAGDVLVEASVRPHSLFQVQGNNLTMDVPITLKEAVEGAKVEIPTLKGSVVIRIPPNTSSGTSFRLREKGLKDAKTGQYGDLLARTKIVLPEKPDFALNEFVEEWSGGPRNPRDALKSALK